MYSCWIPTRPSARTIRNWCSVSGLPTCPPAWHPELHGLIEFASPAGDKFTGMVRELDAEAVLVDFNHPLAGKAIRFEVEVLGIM